MEEEPIRVAHVVGKMVGGGLESVVMNYYHHIDKERIQFDLIVDEDSTLVPREKVEALGGRIFVVPPYQNVFAYQKALINLFKENKWQIVHSHENSLSVFPLRAAKKAGVPVRIAHSHSTAGKGELMKTAIKNLLRPWSSLFPTERAACSKHAGEWLYGHSKEFRIIPNAIELNQFIYNDEIRQITRTKLGIQNDTFVIGHIGRLTYQKNQVFLIDIFESLLKKNSSCMLLLVGEGPDRQKLEVTIHEKNLDDKVMMLGHRSDVASLYQAFDVFVFPSNYEGFGIVALEAQVSGLPCICSYEVPKEAAVTGRCSFLPLSDGADRWADEVLESFSDKTRVLNQSELNALSAYDVDQVAENLTKWYESLYAKL